MNARELKPGDRVLDTVFNQKATFIKMEDPYYFVKYDDEEFSNNEMHPNEDGNVMYNSEISGDEWELIENKAL